MSKNVNIRMSYDTSIDIEKIVENKVNELTENGMVYKDVVVNGVEDFPYQYKRGWSYRASQDFIIPDYYEGKEGDERNYYVEKGDLIIANTTVTQDTKFNPLHWDVYQGNIEEPVDDKYTDIIDGNF